MQSRITNLRRKRSECACAHVTHIVYAQRDFKNRISEWKIATNRGLGSNACAGIKKPKSTAANERKSQNEKEARICFCVFLKTRRSNEHKQESFAHSLEYHICVCVCALHNKQTKHLPRPHGHVLAHAITLMFFFLSSHFSRCRSIFIIVGWSALSSLLSLCRCVHSSPSTAHIIFK